MRIYAITIYFTKSKNPVYLHHPQQKSSSFLLISMQETKSERKFPLYFYNNSKWGGRESNKHPNPINKKGNLWGITVRLIPLKAEQ